MRRKADTDSRTPEARTTNGQTQGSGPPCRVLILEDTDEIRLMLIAAARSEPLCVDAVAATCDARELYLRAKANNDPYDVLVLDIALSGETGLEFAKWVRVEGDDGVTLCFLTAYDGVMNRIEAEDVNAAAFITKPFDPGKLFAKVKELCGPKNKPERREGHGRRQGDRE